MDTYSLYTYKFIPIEKLQDNFFIPYNIKIDQSTEDKNLWLDRLFGERNTDVRIQKINKNGKGTDVFPCKVLAHGSGRVVWLRLENEKVRRLWVKRRSLNPSMPDPIKKEDVAENPFSYIFIDCREGKNLIAIKKENDAWRNTDIMARLLEESLNIIMQDNGYGFGIKTEPVTASKDYYDYNRKLILKDKRKVKKMTIYFGSGTIDPKITAYIKSTPILNRLLKEMWEAKRGKLELENPQGSRIVDRRKRDFKNIITLIGSNITSDAFGLSLVYDNGEEVVCGKEVKLMYPMKSDTISMLFSQNLFGEFPIDDWLDSAVEYINKQKNGTPSKTNRNKKAPKHARNTSSSLDVL